MAGARHAGASAVLHCAALRRAALRLTNLQPRRHQVLDRGEPLAVQVLLGVGRGVQVDAVGKPGGHVASEAHVEVKVGRELVAGHHGVHGCTAGRGPGRGAGRGGRAGGGEQGKRCTGRQQRQREQALPGNASGGSPPATAELGSVCC